MTRTMALVTLLLAVVASCAGAVDVATCEEFAAVDRKTETEVTITAANFTCDNYTRLSIRTDMVLTSSVGKVTFSNLALKVYKSLTVEPDVVFTGVTTVEKSGGAMKIELGAVGVFKGTADFIGNSVKETGTIFGYFKGNKGGAIHNKGNLTFEKDATFMNNRNKMDGVGEGGAISVHVKGSVHFMGNLNMIDNTNVYWIYGGVAKGGAIYNLGDIVIDGEADFTGNRAGEGGAIFLGKWATAVFNGFANFTSNSVSASYGGAVANFGGEVTFEAGSLFYDGGAGNSGDGGYGAGIYNENGGVVTLKGSTTFRDNYAYWGAGIFNRVSPFESEGPDYKVPTIVYPDDTVFENNGGEFCNDVAYDYNKETCGL